MIKIYDSSGKLIFQGTVRKAIEILGISMGHYYEVTKGNTELTYRANYPILEVKGEKFFRKEKKKETFKTGYSFNYKGYPVTITNIEFNEKIGLYIYTYNDNFVTQARNKYKNFNTLWQAIDRALKL